MSQPDKIVHIQDSSEFMKFIKDAERLYKEDTLTDFIGIMRFKDQQATAEWHWFGEKSCYYLIGLVEKMKLIILDYMSENNG